MQNVGSTPRFYVSLLQYLDAIGGLQVTPSSDAIENRYWSGHRTTYLNPSLQLIYEGAGTTWYIRYKSLYGNFDSLMPNDKNFFMVLNHTFDNDIWYSFRRADSNTFVGFGDDSVNYDTNSRKSEFAGFAIGTGNNAHLVHSDELDFFVAHQAGATYRFSSLLYGTYFDVPRSPSLNLKLGRHYGTSKEYNSIKGHSISNTLWDSPPMWNGLGGDKQVGAWELYVPQYLNPYHVPHKMAKYKGRRTWDLTFQMMTNSDVIGSNSNLSTFGQDITTDNGYESGDIDEVDEFNYNILTEDNWFSQVWNKTQNGTLPFVFQQDNTNFSVDQFCIARFKKDTLKITETSIGLMNISISIEECW